ncbi:MAG: type I restriction-modification system subunit M [Candidatus Cloacimonetes bacterium]|nr:type I restriction-modification system subunit M [Candidatus Cloacimonadota bacterium]
MPLIDEKVLWASADKLRGTMGSSEYMHITLGLIFLKYISDRFEERYQELIKKNDNSENDRDYYEKDHIFWVPEFARWNYVKSFSKEEKIGQMLDEAFIEIEKDNDSLNNVMPKSYSKPEVDKRRLGELVDLFENQLKTPSIEEEGDFMGQVYEYFMGKFARQFTEKGGEFFTPRSIVKILVAMLDPTDGRVYDPCCGTGGMFVHVGDFVKAHRGNVDNISVYGQELNSTTWKLAKMNLSIRGIEANLGGGPGDTFHDDMHKALRANYILANPPFNISDYGQPSLIGDPRWKFGTPPEGNANYGWIQHMYSKLAPNGKAGFVLANGSLSTAGKQELEIRRNMLDRGVIDCIITMPDKLFYSVSIPVALWFLEEGKRSTDVLFIDARNLGHMIDRKVRELSQEDIDLVSNTYHNWKNNTGYEDVKGFCKVASLNDIKATGYTLVPGRYVGVDDSDRLSEKEIRIELKKTSQELIKLLEESRKLEDKVKEILDKELD